MIQKNALEKVIPDKSGPSATPVIISSEFGNHTFAVAFSESGKLSI